MFEDVFRFIKNLYPGRPHISLHEPVLGDREKKYLNDCIDSTFVSSVGEFVNRFEREVGAFVGAKAAIVTGNGTAALHASLYAIGVGAGDLVITQALTFVATANAIAYCGADPVFVDSERATLGMSPDSLSEFLETATEIREGVCFHKLSGKPIRACVPMHVFGHPVRLNEILAVCEKFHIAVVEDAAESLGSTYRGRMTGTFGRVGVTSFNGNKIITTGGGGMIFTNDEALGKRLKHLTTTAKLPHAWAFDHDEVGFNYRMPNLNAALGVAQFERLQGFIDDKRETAARYREFFQREGIEFVNEPENCRSNYWLNAILLKDRGERDAFLESSRQNGIGCRPVWTLMSELPMYRDCLKTDLGVAKDIADRLVNLPSSAR